MDLPVSYEDVLAAEPVVHGRLPRTPLYEYPELSRLLGCQYWVKHENHLPVGSFKVRGGVNLVESLSDSDRTRGILAVSTGNHGQSLAWACRSRGIPCTIVVPGNCNPDKKAAIVQWGARLVEHGEDFDEAKAYCEELAREAHQDGRHQFQEGLQAHTSPLYVHSANEPRLIAGVGTYALEVFEDLPDPDVILVPVGLGSGVCGTCLVAKRRSPSTRVFGVQASGAPAVTESWRTGTIVASETIQTHAEGLATRMPAELTLDIMRRYVDDMLLVDDTELDTAIRLLLEVTHNLAEGAGAAATAAAFKIRSRLRGLKVVSVLSGGNLDLRRLRTVLTMPRPVVPDERVTA